MRQNNRAYTERQGPTGSTTSSGKEPGITLAELARRKNVSPPAAHKAMQRRCDVSLEKRAEGPVVHILPKQGARGARIRRT